jgi:D-glycero-D-manno-heptose 1,7-bisphosphate phosphatase
VVRLVILDRDGVINRDRPDFIRRPEQWRPLPGSLEAIAALCRAGYAVAVATNQSGVGRGLFTPETLEAIHARMRAAVADAGGRIEVIASCPHDPAAGCRCRKPATGLLEGICSTLGIPIAGVPCVGDSARDIEAAVAIGARPILVLTGNGRRTAEALGPARMPEVFEDLAAAARQLIREAGT